MFSKSVGKISNIINSRSWRLTGPFRFLYDRLAPLRFFRFLQKKNLSDTRDAYQRWIVQNEPNDRALAKQKSFSFSYSPFISIVTPTLNTPRSYLQSMLDSVIGQTYSNWELCIADGASTETHVCKMLKEYGGQDSRIKIRFLSENRKIAGNSNAALSMATGEFVALLDHDDTFAPFALFEVVRALNEHPDTDYLYSDEDKLGIGGAKRIDPFFKPDWSPDTFRSYNYTCHLSVFRKSLLDDIGGFRRGFEGSQDYDLILRSVEKARRIVHIPKILYHWRMHSGSTAWKASKKTYAMDSARKALAEHLERAGEKGFVEDGLFPTSYLITYPPEKPPLVSIIIANKDHPSDLSRCVQGILKKSSWQNFEILIVENGSQEEATFQLYEKLKKEFGVRILQWEKTFNFSAINNFAAQFARGDLLLFLNNDTEIINTNWLERMVEHACRTDIGAVGAKLHYPDNTIQHAGVILGIGGVAGHSHKGFSSRRPGHGGRLQVVQNLSAVTGACMMVRKKVFHEVGGFDEGYAFAFNDVDLCMKIRKKNYRIVWTPFARLYHYESKTRGLEDTPEKQARFQNEMRRFQGRWRRELKCGDPFYNPNLTLELEDFSVKSL